MRQSGEKTSFDVAIKDDTTLASEHNLVNVKIERTMHDRKNKKYYALAVMQKAETADILYNMIMQNMKEISSYSETSSKERDLLKKYSLVMYVAAIAEKNDVYVAQIFHLNKAMSENLSTSIPNVLTSQYLYIQAHNIINKVAFGISCESNSIASAIKKMLGDIDFVVNNKTPVYIFDEKWDIKGSDMYGMFTMNYTLDISIRDARSNEILKTFSFSGKEIGSNEADAMKNAQNYLGKTMGSTLSQQFTEYLNSLLDIK